MSVWTRIRNALRPDALNRELEAEIQTHYEEMQEKGVARLEYGNALRFREESHDIKSLPWLESLRADVVFGWRQLVKKKTASIVCIMSLALGIGATASVLRLLEAGFLRPLAIRDAGQLYFLRYTTINVDGKSAERDSFAYPEMLAMRDALKLHAELLMVSFADRQDITYGDTADVEKVSRQYVSGNLFEDFALRPAAGRLFGSAEDTASADHHVAVISHSYWQRRFGLDPAAVGKAFRHGTDTYRIVGVVEPAFTGTSTGAFTDIFLPLLSNQQATRSPQAARWTWARILVHLKPHSSPDAITDQLRAVFVNYRSEAVKSWPAGTPKAFIDAYQNAQLKVLPAARGVSNFHRDYLMPLTILAVTASLVLLLSCAGVANLLTAQSASRAKEMALRVSIGAGRGRLIQLLLVESFMLAAAAAGMGLIFSWWATPAVVAHLNPPDNPVRLHLTMDWRVLLLGVVLSVAVTLLFGLLPAFQASSLSPVEALKGGMNTRRRLRFMRSLVAVQVTFCFLVCFVASLTIASLRHLDQQPLGFAPERILLVDTMATGGTPAPEVWRQLVDRAGEIKGVKQAALSGMPVQSGVANIAEVQVGDRPVDVSGPYVLAVSGGWFSTMKIPLREGRDFRRVETEPGVIVNEQFARHYFAGRSAYGERISFENRSYQVVGVTGDIRIRDLREAVRPTAYLPFGEMRNGTLTLRLDDNAREADLVRTLRQGIAERFPQLNVVNVRTQMDLIRIQTVRERLLAALSSFFGCVALVLAGMGLYAVLSYTVSQRRREIAIRMALGARAMSVASGVASESVTVLALGAAAGLVVGLTAQKLIRSFLFEVSGSDPGVLGAAALALLTACSLAAAAPVARAVRTDPAQTLRSE